MSVPTWERTLSSSEYINKTAELNDALRSIVFRKPAKYRQAYGDRLIQEGIDAYLCAYDADKTLIRKGDPEGNFDRRINLLKEARAHVDHVEFISELFLGAVQDIDGINKEKLSREQQRIGTLCYQIKDMINGVIKNTKERKKEAG